MALLRIVSPVNTSSSACRSGYWANRLLAIIGSMYGFAARRGLVPRGTNPAAGLERFRETSQERYLTTEELGRLGESLALSETRGLPWATHHGELVIPGAEPSRPRSDLKKPWHVIQRHAGLEGVRLHDLRHTFASVGAGATLGLPVVGKLLGHSQPATTARYAHLDADPLRRATDLIGPHLASALAGRTKPQML